VTDDKRQALEKVAALLEEAIEIATPLMRDSPVAQDVYWKVGGTASVLRLVLEGYYDDDGSWSR